MFFFQKAVNFAVALLSSSAGRAVVTHLDGIVTLVEVVGYPGNHPQPHNQPYTHQRKLHNSQFSTLNYSLTSYLSPLTSISNPALVRLFQKCGYDFVTTCGLLIIRLPDFMAKGANESAIRWSL